MFSIPVTPDIELFPLEERHAEELFDLTDENRFYLREWLPWLDEARDVGDTLMFIRGTFRSHADTGACTCGIWFQGKLCGVIGHNRLDPFTRTAWIGYWLNQTDRGQGIATQSCRALIDHTFRELPVDKIMINCGIFNTASQAIPDRLGFTREGTLIDAEWLYDHFIDHTVNVLVRPGGAGS
jgi:ribosomal-protein-serine acetyltransferase